MDWKKSFIEEIESKTNERVSWQSAVEFFADNSGLIMEEGTFIFQSGYYFFVSDGKSKASFYAPDINFKDMAKKQDALDFINGKAKKLKNISLFFSLFSDSVFSYELEGGYVCFVKTKGNQLNSLIDIAISKQKYSLAEYNRLHPVKVN